MSLTSAVIGIFCFLALVLCWSVFNMMTAYDKVKAASAFANGSPLVFCNNRVTYTVVRSFVAGRGPAYSRLSRWDLYISATCQPREKRGIGRCVRCMCALCREEEGTVGMSSSSVGMAYCLAKPELALIQCQPWPALLQHLSIWLTPS